MKWTKDKTTKPCSGRITFNSPKYTKEIKVILENISPKKTPNPDEFTSDSTTHVRKNCTNSIQTLSENCREWNTLQLTLQSQPYSKAKTRQKLSRKDYRPISFMNVLAKTLKKILTK